MMDFMSLLQPSEDDRKRALTQGLLSAGLGILANNRGRNAGPAIGAGGLLGMQGYQQSLGQSRQDAMQRMQVGMMAQKMQEEQRRKQGIEAMLNPQAITPEQAGSMPGGPTNENAEMIGRPTQTDIGGMPLDQARMLYSIGGEGALSKALAQYARPTDFQLETRGLSPEDARFALARKFGLNPEFIQADTGGALTFMTRDPRNNNMTTIGSMPKTAAPGSRPMWLNADNTIDEGLYQRQAGLNRAGASQGASLTISSPLIPGAAAQNTNDQGILDAGQMMSGMTAIQQEYRPEFQTLGTRWNALKTSMKERLGLGVSKDDKALLEDFTRYRGRSANALNQYIKAMTGAALTEAEAERLTKAIPFAGTGMWDGDSPTEFKAKMDAVTKDLRMAMARRSYIKRQGFSLGQVQLEQMPKIMNDRGAQLKDEIKSSNPNVPDQEVGRMVRRRLAEEFGLVYEQ